MFLDHPIDPPKISNDAWDIEFPADLKYTIKSNQGVFNVFVDEECTKPLNYPYIKLDQFVQDMQIMCNMIADGPL